MKLRSGVRSALAGASVLALTSLAVPAFAAVNAPVNCPKPMPTAKAVDGLQVTGFSVVKGNTPAPFTGTVLGRITDGIAPGVDMIMAKLDSETILSTGIWAGMSGSPVYASDGSLIGAVSYSLAAGSPIAGITPASDMLAQLGKPKAAAQQKAQVKVPAVAAPVLRAAGAPAAAAAAGGNFTVLDVPVAMAGLNRLPSAQAKFYSSHFSELMPNAHLVSGGAAGGGAPAAAPAGAISAGSNFVAAISTGSISGAGIGTTTAVCSGKAVAFGHPMLFNGGDSRLAINAGDALFIQADKNVGSFKVANIGGLAGTLTHDGIAGISGTLGAGPKGIPVTSTVTAGGTSKKLATTVYDPDFLPMVAGMQTDTGAILALDSTKPGTATLTYKVTGKRANGKTFTLSRTERAFTDTLGFGVFNVLDQLQRQSLEKIQITGVSMTETVVSGQVGYRVQSVSAKKGASYVKVADRASIAAKAGTPVQLKVSLAAVGGGSAKTVPVSVPVGASLTEATLNLSAGAQMPLQQPATSFAALLAQLAKAPSGDTLLFTLDGVNGAGKTITTSVSVSAGKPVQEALQFNPLAFG